jgi:hypothetical protein
MWLMEVSDEKCYGLQVKLKRVKNVSVTTRFMKRGDEECSGNQMVLRRDGEKLFFLVTPCVGQQVMEEFLYFSLLLALVLLLLAIWGGKGVQ